MTLIVHTTSNPGKVAESVEFLARHGIPLKTATSVKIPELDVAETGKFPEENARLKVSAYLSSLNAVKSLKGKKILIVADDTALHIDGLNGEPGVHVRRWKDKDTAMTDEEIIEYALLRMKNLKGAERRAMFRTTVAIGIRTKKGDVEEPQIFSGILQGRIVEKATEQRTKGFPFESLFFVEDWNMMLGTMHKLPDEKKKNFFTHRQRALQHALPWIRKELL